MPSEVPRDVMRVARAWLEGHRRRSCDLRRFRGYHTGQARWNQ